MGVCVYYYKKIKIARKNLKISNKSREEKFSVESKTIMKVTMKEIMKITKNKKDY